MSKEKIKRLNVDWDSLSEEIKATNICTSRIGLGIDRSYDYLTKKRRNKEPLTEKDVEKLRTRYGFKVKIAEPAKECVEHIIEQRSDNPDSSDRSVIMKMLRDVRTNIINACETNSKMAKHGVDVWTDETHITNAILEAIKILLVNIDIG